MYVILVKLDRISLLLYLLCVMEGSVCLTLHCDTADVTAVDVDELEEELTRLLVDTPTPSECSSHSQCLFVGNGNSSV